jgi:maleylacetoacetate isomerase
MPPEHVLPEGKPTLYGYWRSSAAYRVRIALELKGIAWESAAVHLVRDGGEQHATAFRELNPAGLVPALKWGDLVLTQSLAICEYLDEVHPAPPLLPEQPEDRAFVRALAMDIACDVHPLNNLRVMQYLGRQLAADEAARQHWMHHWMRRGFATVEQRLSKSRSHSVDSAAYCFGRDPGLADICLVAQAYNADRFGLALDDFPQVQQVLSQCRALPAFLAALPEAQPDADLPAHA